MQEYLQAKLSYSPQLQEEDLSQLPLIVYMLAAQAELGT